MATVKKPAVKKVTADKKAVAPVAVTEKTETKKSSDLVASVFSVTGEKISSLTLAKELFGVAVNTTLLAQAVRVFLANQREGTASTKTRGEVEGSTRKIYKQKGTGRARHGAIRAPLFVGGGIVFGPRPRDYSLVLPQAMRVEALKSALSQKQKTGNIVVVEDAAHAEPKTKIVANGLTAMGLSRTILIVTDDMHGNYVRAAKNLEHVDVIPAAQVHAYAVFSHKYICITKEALKILENRISKKA